MFWFSSEAEYLCVGYFPFKEEIMSCSTFWSVSVTRSTGELFCMTAMSFWSASQIIWQKHNNKIYVSAALTNQTWCVLVTYRYILLHILSSLQIILFLTKNMKTSLYTGFIPFFFTSIKTSVIITDNADHLKYIVYNRMFNSLHK